MTPRTKALISESLNEAIENQEKFTKHVADSRRKGEPTTEEDVGRQIRRLDDLK
jgi:hypothetical protein